MTEQISVSRRSFLGGALALAVATAVPAHALGALGPVPVICGDGIHDDTAGLQAAFDNKPFRIAGEGVYVVNRGGTVYLSSGQYRLTDTLVIRNAAVVTGGTFIGKDIPPGQFVLRVENASGSPVALQNMHIEAGGSVVAAAVGRR